MFADLLNKLRQPGPEPLSQMDEQTALVALLVRLARSDGYYEATERAHITRIAAARFDLSENAADELRKRAEQLEAEAPDTVRFTKEIKESVPYEQRIGVIEALWQVALADGERDANEDALIRMATRFLGVSDPDSARARQRVQKAG